MCYWNSFEKQKLNKKVNIEHFSLCFPYNGKSLQTKDVLSDLFFCRLNTKGCELRYLRGSQKEIKHKCLMIGNSENM